MSTGDISYSNIVALSIDATGKTIAVSDNSDVKVYYYNATFAEWKNVATHSNTNVTNLSLSPNGLKLGMKNSSNAITIEETYNTEPPVITLNGNEIVNIVIGNDYVEQGCEEVLDVTGDDISSNVIISGGVDTNTISTYYISYNVVNFVEIAAVQVIREVTVIRPAALISLSQDIFSQIVDFKSNMTSLSNTNNETFIISDHTNTYLNGTYNVQHWGTQVNDNISNIFDAVPSHNYYQSLTNINIDKYGYYKSHVDENGTLINHSINDIDGVNHKGFYIEYTFPFHVEPDHFVIKMISNQHIIRDITLLGVTDSGDYREIGSVINNLNNEITILTRNSPQYYKTFRVVFKRLGYQGALALNQVLLYGKIYTMQ